MMANNFTKIPVAKDTTKIMCIGATGQGQIGINGFGDDDIVVDYPVEIRLKLRVKSIACGDEHSHLLTVAGNLYSMGSNVYG